MKFNQNRITSTQKYIYIFARLTENMLNFYSKKNRSLGGAKTKLNSSKKRIEVNLYSRPTW